ncbi:MAG: hypothetical protein WBE86_00185 [Candidatus Acidiferrales bacterium]
MKNTSTALCLLLLLSVFVVSAMSSASPVMPADQAAAVGCLRSIVTAEAYYSKHYPAGFSPTLASLGVPDSGVQPSASAAGLLDNTLTGGTKNGYVFTYVPGAKDSSGKITSYTITARPNTWKTGMWSFFADETGVIRWTDENRVPKVTDGPL